MLCVLKALLKNLISCSIMAKQLWDKRKSESWKVCTDTSCSCSCTEGSQSPSSKIRNFSSEGSLLYQIFLLLHTVVHLQCMPLCQTPPLKHRWKMEKRGGFSQSKTFFDSLMPIAAATRQSEAALWRAARISISSFWSCCAPPEAEPCTCDAFCWVTWRLILVFLFALILCICVL